MSAKERVRLDAMHRIERNEMTVVSAAELMCVSLRQARRLWKRYRQQGAAGLIHRSRGRASNRRLGDDVRERVLKRYQERYADFGPTLACEKLAEDGLVISADTLVALLKQRHLWQPRRRRGKHRLRRARRASFGSMIQMDGSHHDWFEGRSGWCVLMVLIDDASNQTYARFYSAETTLAAMDVLGRWVKKHGVPRSVYVDRHSIYRDEGHPEEPTQFGRAMKELQVALICAGSPQAKGRVERRHRVFQDRLVKEMRLRKISDMAQGNALLEQFFLEDLNRRYAVKPQHETDLHRVLPPDWNLEEILCVQERRVVGRDWCVRWRNQWLQIPAKHAGLALAGKKVVVKQLGDGALLVSYQGQNLDYRKLSVRPTAVRERPVVVNRRVWKPGADHPWKKDGVGRAARRNRCGGPAAAAVGASPLPAPTPARPSVGASMSG